MSAYSVLSVRVLDTVRDDSAVDTTMRIKKARKDNIWQINFTQG